MSGKTPCTVLSAPPPIIALCGHPRHGKSTVQGFLQEVLGVTPMDDGLPIRLEGMKRFGLTWEQVSTQAGKLEMCHAFDREMEVREALGLIGKEWEEQDPLHVPELAMEHLRLNGPDAPVSYGSVRRGQGRSYKRRGGLVLEIVDPRKPQSSYDFDHYDSEWIDLTLTNDGDLSALKAKSVLVVERYLQAHKRDYSWN